MIPTVTCFDCRWHLRHASMDLHVDCRYPRERAPVVVDLTTVNSDGVFTHRDAATVCPAFTRPPESSQSRVTIPPGFALVPVDPPPAMLEAGWGICGTSLSSAQPDEGQATAALLRYRAMLAASPTPPASAA